MATTNAYTTEAFIQYYLPKNYDSTTDLPSARVTVVIGRVCREIDAYLSAIYVPFNATTDTPATPKTIEDIATHLAVAQCYDILTIGDRNTALGQVAKKHEDWARSQIDALLNGYAEVGRETKTGAVLTPGVAGSYDLDTTDAFIGVESLATGGGEVTVQGDTVRVTSPSGYTLYHYLDDFEIYFHPKHRKWVFRDLRDDFINQTSPTISYQWSYERYQTNTTPGRTRTGVAGGF